MGLFFLKKIVLFVFMIQKKFYFSFFILSKVGEAGLKSLLASVNGDTRKTVELLRANGIYSPEFPRKTRILVTKYATFINNFVLICFF